MAFPFRRLARFGEAQTGLLQSLQKLTVGRLGEKLRDARRHLRTDFGNFGELFL